GTARSHPWTAHGLGAACFGIVGVISGSCSLRRAGSGQGQAEAGWHGGRLVTTSSMMGIPCTLPFVKGLNHRDPRVLIRSHAQRRTARNLEADEPEGKGAKAGEGRPKPAGHSGAHD